MSDQKPRDKAEAVRRRDALKGIGALLVAAPSLAATRCGGSDAAEGASHGTTGEGGPAATAANSDIAGRAGGSAGANPPAAPPGQVATVARANPGAATAGSAAVGGTTPARASAGQPAAGSGGAPTTLAVGGGGAPAAAATGSAGSSASQPTMGFIPVTFDAANSCTLTPTDPAGEGPFFIHDTELMDDVSLMRVDMRDGKPGVELQLNLRLLDSEGMCMQPIAGVEVYTWHTDASGFYSGFANQNPDRSYMGGSERTVENMDRFCRGIQVSDEQGVVRFKTVYPGWYSGRAIHVHFLALRPGSGPSTMDYRGKQYMVFTTQFYFAESFSRMIHEEHEPYKQRASGMAYNSYVKPQNMIVNPSMRMEAGIAVGTLNIVTAAMGSRR